MTDRFVTVPDSLELPAAVKVPVARLVGPTGAAVTPADLAAATAAQGALAASASQPGHTHTLDATTDTATRVAMTPAERTELASLSSTYAAKALRAVTALRPPVPSSIVTNFQSGHGFTLYNSTGASLADDTTEFTIGSQCANVTMAAAGNLAANLQNTSLPALDATGKDLLITVRVEDIAHLSNLLVYATHDSGFTHYYSWTVQETGSIDAQAIVKSGEWATLTLNFASATAVGSPQRNALTVLRLTTKCALGYSTNIRWQRVALVPSSSSAVVTITTDDIYASNWSLMRPILDAYGYGATMYAIPSRAGTILSTDLMHRLEDQCGWEIAGHGLTNLLTMTADEAEAAVVATRAWLQTNGFRGVDHYSYPLGGTSPALEQMMRRYYRSARSIYSRTRVEGLPPANAYRLRSRSVDNATTAATVTAELSKVATEGSGWYILTFHDLVTSGADVGTKYLTADFQTIVDQIYTLGLSVKTVGEVIAGL